MDRKVEWLSLDGMFGSAYTVEHAHNAQSNGYLLLAKMFS
jgi:hypothetical protein